MSFTYAGRFNAKLTPGEVYEVYVTSTRLAATFYTDRSKTTSLTPFSVQADSSGNVTFFADPGAYTLVTRGNESQLSKTFRTWPGGIDVSVVADVAEFDQASATLDAIAAPVASVNMNSQKFTSLAAPAVVSDSARLQDTNQMSSINAQTGTTYTFVLGDAGGLVTSSNTSAQTVSIPTNASVAFPVGTRIMVAQLNTAQATVSAANSGTTTVVSAGATVAAPKTSARYAVVEAIKTATDTWIVGGQVA